VRLALPLRAAALGLALLAPVPALAGGGPADVLVLYSFDDPDSTAVAKHYESVRSLPPGHLCGLTGFFPIQQQIDASAFQTQILGPLDACLAALPHPDEIDYLVLVRGLPYLVTLPSYTASLEAVLQVGHTKVAATMTDLAGAGQPMPNASVPNPLFPQSSFFDPALSPVTNQYSAWYSLGADIVEQSQQVDSFRRRDLSKTQGGYTFSESVFVVSSLDGFDYADATALVDRGAAADGTFPPAELLCMHGEDDARGARDPECELVTRMLTDAGLAATFVDPFDGALAGHTLSSYFTGSADTVKNAIAGNVFVPGAMTDNLTSFGAAPQNFFCSPDGLTCPAAESQTSIARFVRAGATGAHGTANEPFNNVFPNAGAMLLYTFGYSMGESYLFAQRFLYWQNLHLGDPLTSPWAVRPVVTIAGDTDALVITATHPNGIAHIDLFEAGTRIAEIDGAGELTVPMPGAVGEELDLLAVATAENAPVMRPGWPEPAQEPRPDVKGWTSNKLVLAALMGIGGAGGGAGAGGSAGEGGSGGGTTEPGGCDCSLPGDARGGGAAAFVLALLALGRRQSTHAKRSFAIRTLSR